MTTHVLLISFDVVTWLIGRGVRARHVPGPPRAGASSSWRGRDHSASEEADVARLQLHAMLRLSATADADG